MSQDLPKKGEGLAINRSPGLGRRMPYYDQRRNQLNIETRTSDKSTMLKTAGSDSSPHRMTSTIHNTAISIRLLHLTLDSAALSSAAEVLTA